MNEKVKKFIESGKAKEKERREEILIELDLYEKEYSPKEGYSEEYPFFENEGGKDVRYRKVACEVTDEEYDEIIRIARVTKNKSMTNNPIAKALTVIAVVIYVAGFIMGCSMGTELAGWGEDFSFDVALIYWSITLISGTVFLGFAEIIKLLQDIRNK